MAPAASPTTPPPPASSRAAVAPTADVGEPETERCVTKLRPDRKTTIPLLSTDRVPALITLGLGESACLEVELQGREIRPVRVVDAATPGGRYIAVSFGMVHGQRALAVRHSETRAVRYSASIVVQLRDGRFGAKQTSTCPVAPGIFGAELWEEPVTTLVFGGFHFAEGDMGCHE